MPKKLTSKELIERKQHFFNFDELLKPYEAGGTEEEPVRRTMGTMVDYFINKKKYPIDVAGAAIFLTFMEMKEGKVFKGDGTYGSPGREMVSRIRLLCDAINQRNLQSQLFQQMAQANLVAVSEFIAKEIQLNAIPMPLRLFAPSRWRWVIRRREKRSKKA